MAFFSKNNLSQDESINIEVSDKHTKLRIILFIVLLAFGLTMMGRGLFQMLSQDPGWRAVEPNKTEDVNCSEDFVLMYNIGASGISATEEYKQIVSVYSDATVKAFQLFTNHVEYEDVHNIYHINQHPNEVIEVEETLYKAFTLLQEYGNRNIYLAPIYEQYDDMFYSTDESEIVYYDPYSSEEVAKYYQEIATFAADAESIELQLLGDNKIKLYVSEKYLNYAEENYITSYIDFFWMKNAFIIDYLAETLISEGFTLGTISSYDGYCRNLDASDTSYSFNVYDKPASDIFVAGTMNYTGVNSIVSFRDYILYEKDENYYYKLQNGDVRTSYIDVADGKCRSAASNLISYSKETGCAEVLMNVIPIYIADSMEEEAMWNLRTHGIYSVYSKEGVVYYNDSTLEFSDMYMDDEKSYTIHLIEK